ncbi:sugar ABC transporter permease [Flexivirga sp. ID2601S]|uniref:Sugar ABC transporter permease n=1 Tax=Flexivirga aerilata TaxID=1656889 RepID=A0A849AJP9_9MICO|nr:sugar ABC transporter permease [Flexivirga aerilata]NNG39756.1 sugar ABC transporter permease [Flexivirga aerilata]
MVRTHRWFTPWIMVLPALVILCVFALWPAVNTFFLSFTDVRTLSGGTIVGLDNYRKLVDDPQLRAALVNTVVYVVVCVPLLTFLPLLLAILAEKPLRGLAIFRTIFYFPVIASAVAVAVIWKFLLDDRGLINGWATHAGIIQDAVPFLSGRWLLLFSAISLTVWKGLGYYMVLYLSALGNVDPQLHEAAAVDGAGPIRRFWSVTVPGVRRTMVLVAILVMVSAMRIFTELYILGGKTGGVGGQDVSVVFLIQSSASGADGRLGYASALSVLLFVMTLPPMALLARFNRKVDE